MEKESIKVLKECIILQEKKANDYQNPNSRVKQADYYINGINTLVDICWAKMLRIISVLEAMENDDCYAENFESLEDSFKDLANYCSFSVGYLRGKIDGQDPTKNIFNKPKNKSVDSTAREALYKSVGFFKGGELSIILNYLLKRNFNFKVNNYNVLVDTSNLDTEGFKILQNNLAIELLKY
jgi:hypothetical protein